MPDDPKDDPQADGYYDDDDMGSEELDLNFLDQNDDQDENDHHKAKK